MVGFTGTPLLRKDKKTTRSVFGSYIHTYKFDQAVADGVILDLKYEARNVPQRLTSKQAIDDWFEVKTKGLNNFQQAVLRKRWATMEELMSAGERKQRIVASINLMTVAFREARPFVTLDHKRITLTVRLGSTQKKREQVIHEWHKSLLHQTVPPLIRKWEKKLGVEVAAYFLQRMKTKWGSCTHQACRIRLNTELVKKPKDLLEYVIVHEMVHLIEPTHSDRFIAILGEHYPSWREARAELNELPLAAEVWGISANG